MAFPKKCEPAASGKRKRRKVRKRNKKGTSDATATENQPVHNNIVEDSECALLAEQKSHQYSSPQENSIRLVNIVTELDQTATHKASFEAEKQDLTAQVSVDQMASAASNKKEKKPRNTKQVPVSSPVEGPATVKEQASTEGLVYPVPSTESAKLQDGLSKSERRAQHELQEKERKDSGSCDLKEQPIAGGSQEGLAGGEPSKSKAQLKAERRAIQEAQRAAKAAAKAGTSTALTAQKPAGQKAVAQKSIPVTPLIKKDEVVTKSSSVVRQQPLTQKKVQFFSHLQQYRPETLSQPSPFSLGELHPAILRLGLQYADGVVCGSNARCVAMLHALKQVILDYSTPPNKELSRDLDEKIKPCIDFLQDCRPLSISIENAVKHLKRRISQISSQTSDDKAKKELVEEIDRYIEEHITLAGEGIAVNALAKINDGDVVLTFSHSSVINNVLITAHRDHHKNFKVVIVDSRPKLEGKKALVSLVKHGLNCSYVMMNALSYTMQKVTKVLLGAHAILANGYVLSRLGSSQVALVAKAYNVPVLVCCETHKFSERVQTDSFVSNELGNPDDLASACLATWRDVPSLTLLNLVYDLTPPDLISAVVTEIGGLLPCTSVPVVLRLKQHRS